MTSSLFSSSSAVDPSGYVTTARPPESVETLSPLWITRSTVTSLDEPSRARMTRVASVSKIAHPDLGMVVAADASSLPPEGILIEGDDLGCEKSLAGLVGHRAYVVAGHERSRERGPEREVRASLVGGERPVSDLEHVGIVPVIRTGVRMEVGVAIEDRDHAGPVRLDVPRRTPEMAERAGPRPRVRASPLADRQHHRSSGRVKSHRPLRVESAWTHALRMAPVDLDVVDAPLGERARIAELIAEARGKSLAGVRSGVGVDAEAQPERVHVLGERADAVRETVGMRDEVTVPIALGRHPAVVDHHVAVAGVAHARLDHGRCGLPDEALVDLRLEAVPAVPAHRRRRREAVGWSTDAHYGTTATRRAP